MKSIQTINNEKVTDNQKQIALYLECRKCGFGRVYLIDENLWLLQNKEISSLGIEVKCEKCNNIIYAGIGYVNIEKGLSYKKPDFFGKKGFQVIDENGLRFMEIQK